MQHGHVTLVQHGHVTPLVQHAHVSRMYCKYSRARMCATVCKYSSSMRATVCTHRACVQLSVLILRAELSVLMVHVRNCRAAPHLPKHTHTHTATHLPKHPSYPWPSCQPRARRYFSPRFSLLCLPFYLPVYLQIAVPVHTCVPTHACVYVPI